MSKNKIQIIHKDKVVSEASIEIDLPDRSVTDQAKGTNIVRVNEEGTTLMQVKHELLNVGESIAQVKYSTSATVTKDGNIAVSQFKQEVSSRGEDVWYYKNSQGSFVGALKEAKLHFPDVDFSNIKIPPTNELRNPEFPEALSSFPQPLKWETINEYDAEKNGGPTTWDKWADATQTALDIVGMIPALGEIADCINGCISLARGNYGDAALSFAAMIPFFGTGATIVKQARKFKKIVNPEDAKGVYDLILKNGDDIKGYVGQSKNVFQRLKQHFNPKRGKLVHNVLEKGSVIHKMPGSTKPEREMYEQFIILKKYKESWKDLGYLINKVNPVGGKFDLKTPIGRKQFYKAAEKIADKYNLPKEFPDYLNN